MNTIVRLLAIITILLVGCEVRHITVKPVLLEDGEIFLYSMPFPREAEQLSFELGDITAVDSEGREFPLQPVFSGFEPGTARRQRLVASGRLPAGQYTGFLFTVKSASVAAKDGQEDALRMEGPARADFSFLVTRGKAQVIWLKFRDDKSFPTSSSFLPVFEPSIPERQPPGVAGYVVNSGSNNVTVFDKQRNEVTGVIATGQSPTGAALDARDGRLYVALSGESGIDVIDVQSWDTITRVAIARGESISELAVTPDGRKLITVNTDSSSVSIVDTGSLFEEATVPVGDGPESVIIDPSGRRAFVFNTRANTISVVDIGTAAVVATVVAESRPLRGQFNRNGDKLYIVHGGSPYIVVLDPRSLSVTGRGYVGMGISCIKVDTRTELLYVAKKLESRVMVYDPMSFVPIDSIETEGPVTYMTIDGETDVLHLVIPSRRMVAAAGLVSKRIVGAVDVNDDPFRVVISGER